MVVLMFIIVFIIGYLLISFIQGVFCILILFKIKLDFGGQMVVILMIGYVGVVLVVLLVILVVGINLILLVFVVGVLLVGIGFGMQQVVLNFVLGIILLVECFIVVGDWIEVGGQQGIVKKMVVCVIQIQIFDRMQVIVLNLNFIMQLVMNWIWISLQGCIIVLISVVNGLDYWLVIKILCEIVEDQLIVMVMLLLLVFLCSVNVSGQNYELCVIILDINGGVGVILEINYQIFEWFVEVGIILFFSMCLLMDVFL